MDREDIFFRELVNLKVSMIQLEKVTQFPWDELELKESYIYFLRTFIINYTTNIVLIMSKLLVDKNKDFLTLNEFRNDIIKEMKKKGTEDKLKELSAELKSLKPALDELLKKVRVIRHSLYAHLKKEILSEDLDRLFLSVEELSNGVDLIEQHYNTLKKYHDGSRSVLVPIEYFEQFSEETDIDRILKLIAKDNELLQLEKTNPLLWEKYLEKWDKSGKKDQMLKLLKKYK